jgi:hypothetical protein
MSEFLFLIVPHPILENMNPINQWFVLNNKKHSVISDNGMEVSGVIMIEYSRQSSKTCLKNQETQHNRIRFANPSKFFNIPVNHILLSVLACFFFLSQINPGFFVCLKHVRIIVFVKCNNFFPFSIILRFIKINRYTMTFYWSVVREESGTMCTSM